MYKIIKLLHHINIMYIKWIKKKNVKHVAKLMFYKLKILFLFFESVYSVSGKMFSRTFIIIIIS